MSTDLPDPETEAESDEAQATADDTSSPETRREARKAVDTDGRREAARRRAEERAREADQSVTLTVFRYDPEVSEKANPRFDEFRVPFRKGMTVLDALIWARDHYDSSLTFRHSCRQAICGSDAMFVNGRQRLACQTQIADLADSGVPDTVRVEPLPHQDVVKDLVVDMEHFYDQMDAVDPFFDPDELPEDDVEEQRQSRENREKIKMATRCIWCGACTSSCNIASGGNYLGPAAINKAYRFAMDEREDGSRTAARLDTMEQENGVWRCQTQFSCTEVCPKDIPLTEHIQELKREAVKSNLKFW